MGNSTDLVAMTQEPAPGNLAQREHDRGPITPTAAAWSRGIPEEMETLYVDMEQVFVAFINNPAVVDASELLDRLYNMAALAWGRGANKVVFAMDYGPEKPGGKVGRYYKGEPLGEGVMTAADLFGYWRRDAGAASIDTALLQNMTPVVDYTLKPSGFYVEPTSGASAQNFMDVYARTTAGEDGQRRIACYDATGAPGALELPGWAFVPGAGLPPRDRVMATPTFRAAIQHFIGAYHRTGGRQLPGYTNRAEGAEMRVCVEHTLIGKALELSRGRSRVVFRADTIHEAGFEPIEAGALPGEAEVSCTRRAIDDVQRGGRAAVLSTDSDVLIILLLHNRWLRNLPSGALHWIVSQGLSDSRVRSGPAKGSYAPPRVLDAIALLKSLNQIGARTVSQRPLESIVGRPSATMYSHLALPDEAPVETDDYPEQLATLALLAGYDYQKALPHVTTKRLMMGWPIVAPMLRVQNRSAKTTQEVREQRRRAWMALLALGNVAALYKASSAKDRLNSLAGLVAAAARSRLNSPQGPTRVEGPVLWDWYKLLLHGGDTSYAKSVVEPTSEEVLEGYVAKVYEALDYYGPDTRMEDAETESDRESDTDADNVAAAEMALDEYLAERRGAPGEITQEEAEAIADSLYDDIMSQRRRAAPLELTPEDEALVDSLVDEIVSNADSSTVVLEGEEAPRTDERVFLPSAQRNFVNMTDGDQSGTLFSPVESSSSDSSGSARYHTITPSRRALDFDNISDVASDEENDQYWADYGDGNRYKDAMKESDYHLSEIARSNVADQDGAPFQSRIPLDLF